MATVSLSPEALELLVRAARNYIQVVGDDRRKTLLREIIHTFEQEIEIIKIQPDKRL